jgi:hypothetical protein
MPATTTKRKKKTMEATAALTLVDKKPRKVLGEGRNYGIGFAFAKRKDSELHLVGPISPCREYLNDQLYSEITGKECYAHGYKAKKSGLLDDECLYVVIAVLPYHSGGTYAGQDKEMKWLAKHYRSIQWLINAIEGMIAKHQGVTSIEELETNRYVLMSPKFWGQSTYLISLLSFLVRVALEGKYETPKDPMEWLKSGPSCTDQYSLSDIIKKIKKMENGNFPKQDLESISYPHGMGILNQSF